MRKEAKFKDLLYKTVTRIVGCYEGSDSVVFVCSDGTRYEMHHNQYCCEEVFLEDVNGHVSDIEGEKILYAEEVQNRDYDEAVPRENQGSYTWTYYSMRTNKGWLDMRWFGTYNGYYSEKVRFEKLKT